MFANSPEAAALEVFLAHTPNLPAAGAPVFVYRAQPGAYLRRFPDPPPGCLQTWYPTAAELARSGLDPLGEPTAGLGLAVVFATKHKEEVLYHIALAATALEPGGQLIVTAANQLGAASLERRCAEAFGRVDSYSKHKCRVFRMIREPRRNREDLLATWQAGGEPRPMAETGLYSQPGMFSWKHVDPGSRLLAQQLPADLTGRGADLGAGYGYLGRELLARCPGITELHLVEAERNALDAAARNLEGYAGKTTLAYHWLDVTGGLPCADLDWIVTNPPFHTGRNSLPALGRAFLASALGALRPGGRLLLVANRHLPYESSIEAGGGEVEQRMEADGFKVIAARKRG